MNFQDIYKKIKAIDEGQQPVEECGGPMDMIAGAMQHPEQPDSVSMNVSMNASGTGGIRDLMSVLHAIEQGATGDDEGGDVEIISTEPAGLEIDAEPHISMNGPEHGDEQGPAHELETDEEYQNEPQPAYQDQEYMNQDLAGGADELQQMHRGGYRNADNPMAMEGLKSNLSNLYQEIKLRESEEKTMSRAAKGVMKYGKDGMQALAKAGKEGKDLDKVRDKYDKYDESAKWRDPKHKDKLYTQNPDDDDDHYDYYHDSRPDNDPGQKHSTFNRDKNTDKLHYPYGDYQVGQKAQVGDRAKKGLLTKNSIRVVKNRINAAHGDHPRPNLPK